MNFGGKRLAMFGCGFEGEKLYYQMKQRGVEFDCAFDNYKSGHFHDIKIVDIGMVKESLGKWLILVSSKQYYAEIREQLVAYGLKEFDNFMPGEMFDKKLVVINANCYGPLIQTFLNSNEDFVKKYYIYETIPIHANQEKKLNEIVVKKCDLFLHQDIREDNPYGYCFSDKYTSTLLKKKCISITIPNLVGMGKAFFPQGDSNDRRNARADMPYGMFPYSDINVEVLAQKGYGTEQIISYIKNGRTYKRSEIADKFVCVVNKFIERERNWDVKIINFILENYKEKKVFYDINHPTNIVLEQIAQGILQILRIPEHPLECKCDLGRYEMPIYPEVRAALDLNYGGVKEQIRINSSAKFMNMNMEEYIKEYIFWCNIDS